MLSQYAPFSPHAHPPWLSPQVGQPLGFMGPTGHFTYEGRGRYAIRGVTGPLTPPVRLMTMVAGGTGG